MEIKITDKITQGMYVLTTAGNGCIVDAVAQVSGGDEPLIAVAVMKKNYTNELMHQNDTFALSVLGKDVDGNVIKTFGFNSGRDINKFEQVDMQDAAGVKVVPNTIGHMVCKKVDMIENDTHTLFIGKVIEGAVFDDSEPLSYGYYREHKNDLLKVKTAGGKTAWICTVCGYIYYGEEVPDDYLCPICGVDKTLFKKM
ncbi:MAG: flavin reductase [Clostridiales bacterium]|nr:flavin reductase [Clostridiales bacterium]